jgi:methyltransferase family protein
MLDINGLRQYQQRPVPELSYATVRDFCDSADHLAEVMLFNGDMKDVQRTWAIKTILGRVPIGGKLLEIGAGEPIVANALQTLGYDVTIIDPYDGTGNGPRAYEQFVLSYPRIKILRAYFEKDIPLLLGQAYDCIYSVSVLEHIPRERLADLFAAISAHLRSGGCSMHCIDEIMAGPKADGQHTGLREILLWQTRLRIPDASEQDLRERTSQLMDEYFKTMAADVETYYLSALGHNVWRGSRQYDEFPFRRVVSVQSAVCSRA